MEKKKELKKQIALDFSSFLSFLEFEVVWLLRILD